MALRALIKGGYFDVIPDFEQRHINELEKTDKAAAKAYLQNEAFVVSCRVISAHESATLGDLAGVIMDNYNSVSRPTISQAFLYACRVCIVNWRNLKDDENRNIEFKGIKLDGKCIGATDEDLDRLPEDVKRNVYEEIRRRMKVAKRDVF